MSWLTSKKRTFPQRLRDQTLFWGIPVLCLELIGMPMRGASSVLLIAIPATILGVFVGAFIETGVIRYIRRNQSEDKEH